MDKDVLLIYPEYTYPRKNQPIGLAYLAGYLREHGYQISIIDFNVTEMTDLEFEDHLKSKNWVVVGVSFMTNQFAEAKNIISKVKKKTPSIPIVVGGVHVSSIPERSFDELPGIDVVAKGEGEQTLLELCNLYSVDRTPSPASLLEIDGVYIKPDQEVLKAAPRAAIEDIDSIPFPAWEYFEPVKYNAFGIHGNDTPTFLLFSSRGCPFVCSFCDSQTIFSRSFRGRKAENIVAEMKFLHDKYGTLSFDFADDLFTTQKDRVYEICDAIENTGIPFQWMVNARVDTVNKELLSRMKETGCVRVDFGVESGDEFVRHKLGKDKISNKAIRDVHKMCMDMGLHTGSFCMVGNLGETKSSVHKTVALMKDIADDVMVSIAIPYPGTDLYTEAKSKGLINTEDWSKYATAPTYTKNYKPVMRNENMTEGDILNAYFFLHSAFIKQKFTQRYGKYFLINGKFFRDFLLKREGFFRRLSMAFKLVVSRLKLARNPLQYRSQS